MIASLLKKFNFYCLAIFISFNLVAIEVQPFIDQGHLREKEGTQSGGGGGLIIREGQSFTFSEAGIELFNASKPLDRVPGLKDLQSSLKHLTLPKEYQFQFKQAIESSEFRKYFYIEAENFPEELRQALYNTRDLEIKRYKKHVRPVHDTDKVGLAAFHIQGPHDYQTTFLYEEFMDLRETSKQAILLVEMGRTFSKVSTIDATNLQLHFQDWARLGKPSYYAPLFRLLGKILKDGYFDIRASYLEDKKNGTLPGDGLIWQGKDKKDYVKLEEIIGIALKETGGKTSLQLRNLISGHLSSLKEKYPDSNWVNALYYAKERIYFCDVYLRRGILHLPNIHNNLLNHPHLANTFVEASFPTLRTRQYFRIRETKRLFADLSLIKHLPKTIDVMSVKSEKNDTLTNYPTLFILPKIDLFDLSKIRIKKGSL